MRTPSEAEDPLPSRLTFHEQWLIGCARAGKGFFPCADEAKFKARVKRLLDRAERIVQHIAQKAGDEGWAPDRFFAEIRKPMAVMQNPVPRALRSWARSGNATEIRAEVLRFLIRGGNAAYPVDPGGVILQGARVTGELDLSACTELRRFYLRQCDIREQANLQDAIAQSISLAGTLLRQGLHADGLTTAGGVFLREGFEARGTVRLPGARIGGVLSCIGGRFLPMEKGANALHADGLTATGSVFLSEGFEARGTVRLVGARIGGNLDCIGGGFLPAETGANALSADRLTTTGGVFLSEGFAARGTVRLLGAQIGGNLDCDGGRFLPADEKSSALDGDGLEVTGGFFWRGFGAEKPKGLVNLTAARVGSLVDDGPESWPDGKLLLDGFRYDRITGEDAPTDAASRIRWLERQEKRFLTDDFRPQPWEWLAQVLREMGHPEDARAVLLRKEHYQRQDQQRRIRNDLAGRLDAYIRAEKPEQQGRTFRAYQLQPFGWLYGFCLRVLGWLFWAFAGYGYSPVRAFVAGVLLILAGAGLFNWAYDADGMVPNDPFTLRSAEWAACQSDPAPHATRAECFLAARKAVFLPEIFGEGDPIYYPPFDPIPYSIDSFVPFLDLHQQQRWIPDPETDAGWYARIALNLHIGLGVIITALFAASVAGLVKREGR